MVLYHIITCTYCWSEYIILTLNIVHGNHCILAANPLGLSPQDEASIAADTSLMLSIETKMGSKCSMKKMNFPIFTSTQQQFLQGMISALIKPWMISHPPDRIWRWFFSSLLQATNQSGIMSAWWEKILSFFTTMVCFFFNLLVNNPNHTIVISIHIVHIEMLLLQPHC